MGIPVLVLGESGAGKSASLRNFEPNEIGIFNVASKPLPFRKRIPMQNTSDYGNIMGHLIENNLNCYIIDDSQYLMAFELFNKAGEAGYAKFTNCAVNFRNLIDLIINKTSDDTIVYLLHHTEMSDSGKIKAKTSGKMLDSQLTLEGLFSIVLMAESDGQKHYFLTQNDGRSTVKTPMKMFDEKQIDNDLKLVDDKIREYYDLAKRKTMKNKTEVKRNENNN